MAINKHKKVPSLLVIILVEILLILGFSISLANVQSIFSRASPRDITYPTACEAKTLEYGAIEEPPIGCIQYYTFITSMEESRAKDRLMAILLATLLASSTLANTYLLYSLRTKR